jgi:hypothetical protein
MYSNASTDSENKHIPCEEASVCLSILCPQENITAQERKPGKDKQEMKKYVTIVDNVPSNFLQLRGRATALSRKFLHYLTTVRHSKSFL